MSTISTILEPSSDGTLHLPIPPELQGARIRVEATLEAAPSNSSQLNGTVLDALMELRALGGMKSLIPDPVAWQREQRQERPNPGR